MKKTIFLVAAGAIALTPAGLIAGPGHGGGGGMGNGATMGAARGMSAMGQGATMGHGSAMGQGATMGHGSAMGQTQLSQPITRSSQGPTNGVGWDHLNGPASTGQPGFECEDIRPGNASSAPGSAFNEEGNAGTHYAGEQPQNSRNTASVSQYDTACLHQPQH